jgi:hypothetical protein
MRLQQGCRSDPDPHERRGHPGGELVVWCDLYEAEAPGARGRRRARPSARACRTQRAPRTRGAGRSITAPSPAPYASACPHERSPSPHKSRTARFGQSTTATSKANLTPRYQTNSHQSTWTNRHQRNGIHHQRQTDDAHGRTRAQTGGHVPIGSKRSPVIRQLLTSHRLAPMARDGSPPGSTRLELERSRTGAAHTRTPAWRRT